MIDTSSAIPNAIYRQQKLPLVREIEGIRIINGQPLGKKYEKITFSHNRFEVLSLKESRSLNIQYEQGQRQIAKEPVILDSIIYDYMPEDEANKILAFLESKNHTKFRYQRLLEIDPSKAEVFINSMQDEDCYRGYFDERTNDMSYLEFMKTANEIILKKLEDSFVGKFSENETNFEMMFFCLLEDNAYGYSYNGVRDLTHSNVEYLSPHSGKWLNYEELRQEKIDLGILQFPKNVVYGEGSFNDELHFLAKPVGYGNKDNYILNLGYQKGVSKFQTSQSYMDLYELINR